MNGEKCHSMRNRNTLRNQKQKRQDIERRWSYIKKSMLMRSNRKKEEDNLTIRING
jgi:hypothetical protein